MEFEHPMPLVGMICFFVTWPVYMCCIWFMVAFPSKLRMNIKFKETIRTYVIYELWWFVVNIQRDVLSFAFKKIPPEIQFIFAVLIPSVKEANKRILMKLVTKMAGKDDDRANVLLGIRLNIHNHDHEKRHPIFTHSRI